MHASFQTRLLYPHWAKERAQDQKENVVNVLLSEDHSISGTISLNYSVPNIEALALINKKCVDLPVQYDHATWIADVPHGEELAFPWLFSRGVNGLFADRSKRLSDLKYFNQRLYNVDACWRKNITYLIFACNYMDQQMLSSEIGIKCVYVRVITRMINSLPMTSNLTTMLYVYEEYQRNCCLLGRYFGQFACNSKVFRPTNIVCNFISWWQ